MKIDMPSCRTKSASVATKSAQCRPYFMGLSIETQMITVW
jgi:hypothetical protein